MGSSHPKSKTRTNRKKCRDTTLNLDCRLEIFCMVINIKHTRHNLAHWSFSLPHSPSYITCDACHTHRRSCSWCCGSNRRIVETVQGFLPLNADLQAAQILPPLIWCLFYNNINSDEMNNITEIRHIYLYMVSALLLLSLKWDCNNRKRFHQSRICNKGFQADEESF